MIPSQSARRMGHPQRGGIQRKSRRVGHPRAGVGGRKSVNVPPVPVFPDAPIRLFADSARLPLPQMWMSGPAGARASKRDRRLHFTSFYRTLREFLSEGKSPFSLDSYLSWMSPNFSEFLQSGIRCDFAYFASIAFNHTLAHFSTGFTCPIGAR